MRYRGKGGGGRGGGGSDQIRYLYPTGGFEGRERKRKGQVWLVSFCCAQKEGGIFRGQILEYVQPREDEFCSVSMRKEGLEYDVTLCT